MQTPAPTFALKARYLFPVAQPPLAGGVITVDDARIIAVGDNLSNRPPLDLENVAIVPGLVNAHTHLEFSHLDAPLGRPGMPFPDWIRAVIASRNETNESAGQSVAAVVERGLRESLECGVTSIGEIAKPSWPAQVFADSPIGATVFLELLGLAKERETPLLELAREHIAAANDDVRLAISPHASYTISAGLLQQVARDSARQRFPVAVHLAESPEELELLAEGSGPLVELLTEVEAWHSSAIRRGARPLDFLQILATANRALVIHGNYLNDDEIDFVAQHAGRLSVVYCPRTHAYFGHDRYPAGQDAKPRCASGIGNRLAGIQPRSRFVGRDAVCCREPSRRVTRRRLVAGHRRGRQSAGD